jgi:replication factor C small subunit
MLIENGLLVEKYRPKTLDGYVCDAEIRTMMEKICANPFSLPHLFLVSKSPGTGKTTLAKIIAKTVEADALYLNASDERGIDVIRFKVKEFASTVSFEKGAPKVIHLDEADGLTKEAQDILRNIMEEFSTNCRFILTANNYNKIIQPLRSRCKEIQLINPPRDEIKKRLEFICKNEKLTVSSPDMDKLIEAHYPDIRSMIMVLDSFMKFGTLNIESAENINKNIIALLRSRKYTEARKMWLSKQINYNESLKIIFELLWNDSTLPKTDREPIIYELAEASYRMAVGADQEITYAKMAFAIMKVIGGK